MTISATGVRVLNKMNTSACETGLGDEVYRLGVQAALVSSSGSLLATGSEVNLTTGITQKGYIVQVNRSGSAGTIPVYVVSTAGNLKVTSASGAAALTTTDTITWIAFE
jgi:hypothetical protein